MRGETRIVVCDIGGTHARFALATILPDGSIELGGPVTLATADYETLHDAWGAFADMVGEELPADASLALAAPIVGDLIPLTNNPWSIRRSELPTSLGVTRHTMLNDFAAIAYAVAKAPKSQFEHLAGPDIDLPEQGAVTVVGPGTGLGVGFLWRDGKGNYHVQPTEGGHIEFGPVDALDDALVAKLRPIHGRVIAERAASGPAIGALCEVIAERDGVPPPDFDDLTLWKLGTSGENTIAAEAVERFCMTMGSLAGDYALVHGAQAVVIAGGLGLRVREQLHHPGFFDRFCNKGSYRRLMEQTPVKLITHPQPGLFGAAAAFAKEYLE